jgi:hypothetical protein
MRLRDTVRAGRARAGAARARSPRARTIFLCASLLCFVNLAATVAARQDEGPTRSLWDTAFGAPEKRPRPAAGRRRNRYRVVTPRVPRANVAPATVIGVTVWRLRPARRSDSPGVRTLTHHGPGGGAWVPERVPANTAFSEGDRVRLSIEAARDGYLYVIDREQYADGTLGEPHLIFPTGRINGGDNRVRVGRLIDLPAQEDDPPYFTLTPGRADQVGELLSVIVTSAPLDGFKLEDGEQKLSAEQVARWERDWGGQVGQLELLGGVGRPWTKEEQDAGTDATRGLRHDAPRPQTLYYSPAARPDAPLLIKLRLRYGRR